MCVCCILTNTFILIEKKINKKSMESNKFNFLLFLAVVVMVSAASISGRELKDGEDFMLETSGTTTSTSLPLNYVLSNIFEVPLYHEHCGETCYFTGCSGGCWCKPFGQCVR